jgi:hypothetical protein
MVQPRGQKGSWGGVGLANGVVFYKSFHVSRPQLYIIWELNQGSISPSVLHRRVLGGGQEHTYYFSINQEKNTSVKVMIIIPRDGVSLQESGIRLVGGHR